MRRCVLILGLLALAVTACGRGSKAPVVLAPPSQFSGDAPGSPGMAQPVGTGGRAFAPVPVPQGLPNNVDVVGAVVRNDGPPPPVADQSDKYDASLAEAVDLLANRKWPEALAALETARAIRGDEGVNQTIAKLRLRIEQEAAADRVAADIQEILNDGKPGDAASLAADALRQFAHTDAAAKLTKLAQQANAVVSAQGGDKKERFAKFKAEYEAADKDKNLRAAALALENALQNGDDDALKQKLDEIRNKLTDFDEKRARAAEQRKDPARIEEAIATLEAAKEVWDSPAVQQDIDDCRFALQNRRERLAVAEFDVRGDVGVPAAGAFVADELLPAFKGKYDLVERGQLDKIVAEMKLENGLADDDLARQKVGEAAKARYLVVGSITPVSGLTVQARLVDAKTGLIVQTAKVVAANADELAARLLQLGQVLMMTDDQKRDFEKKQAAELKKDNAPDPNLIEALKPDPDAALPPPPDRPDEIPPPPIIPPKPRPAPADNIQPAQFANLPPPPAAGQPLPVVVLPAEREGVFRRRAAFVALELGDNLFRRGHFRDALIHFEFCLNLFPEQRDVRLRVERCRPLLPPLDAVAPALRPRVAVLDFLTFGDPTVVPPYFGPETAEAIAPYFAPEYEVVDRATLYWWMGRLGVSHADLLNDPVARQYVGRALGVRYFLFGTLVETASFDVLTYLVDAEYGFLVSGARVHVRFQNEFRKQLSEIAWLTKLAPDERLRIERDSAMWEQLVVEIREHNNRDRFAECIAACRRALKMRPNNVLVLSILWRAERQQRSREIAQARAQESRRQSLYFADLRGRQADLARGVELARLRAEQTAVAEREAVARQREAAARSLFGQAQAAFQGQRFGAAVQFFENAAALAPSDATYRELALARAKVEETARANAAEAAAAREAALRRQRDAELAQARAQLEKERQQRAAEDLARRKFQEDRDRGESARLLDEAQRLSAAGKVAQAVSAAQAAQRLRRSPEADRLVNQLLIELAKANAERQGAAARAELERQLAAEREARVKVELEANADRQKYEQLLAQGNKALQDREFDAAIQALTAAKKLHATDAVLTGLRRAEAAKAEAAARAEADHRKIEEQRQQIAGLKQRLADAEAALAAKDYDKAVNLYREAKTAAPTDVDVLTGLTKAEQLREQHLAAARRASDDAQKMAAVTRFLESGQKNLADGKSAAAALAFGQAVKLDPTNDAAKKLLADARAKAGDDANLQQKHQQYDTLIGDGRRALAAKQYNEAQKAFRAAAAVVPGDAAADKLLSDAQMANLADQKAQNEAARKRQLEAQKGDEVKAAVKKVYDALAVGKLDGAAKAYRDAAQLNPNHPDVVKALGDVRKAQDVAAAAAMAAQQRDARFADLVAKGRDALAAKKSDDAVKFFTDAAAVQPGDAAVRGLLAQATKMRDDGRAGAAADADLKKRQQTYQTAMQAARVEWQAKKFDDALKSVGAALQAMPNDKDALALRQQIDRAKKDAAGAAAAMDAKKQEYAKQMTAARAAVGAKRYDDAVQAAGAALAAMPNDRDALALKAQAERAKADARMEADKKSEYGRQMLQARTAMAARKYDDAIKAYTAALELYPADADATKGLANAKKAAETKPAPPMPMAKPPLYAKQMDAGLAQEKAGKYDLALNAYQAALRLVPGDADATKKVEFCQALVDGGKAMQQRKFPDAVKAYESALKLFPNDQAAKQALARAKAGK